VVAGSRLARAADAIADRTGIGRVWIGSVLLACATSLPELVTDVAAVRLGVPDLAAGDVFGSSMANMLILALVDLLPPRGRVLRGSTIDHALGGSLAIVLTALAAAFVMTRFDAGVAGVGLGSLAVAVLYVAGTRAVYLHGRRPGALPADLIPPPPRDAPVREASVRPAVRRFLGGAVAILVAAPVFAWAAARFAELSGLGQTFVGTWLVGFCTSLPELVTSIVAVRMGAFDLAVGNLFGSNAFNMTLFVAMDLAHPGGPVFGVLSGDHVLAALLAVLLMGLGIAAIAYRAERRFAMIELDSVLIVLAYALGMWLVYGLAAGR
jgi:cation:H+ antiporter